MHVRSSFSRLQEYGALSPQRGRYGCHPGINAPVGLVVLVDVVQWQADKLAVNHCFGIVVSIAIGGNAPDKSCAAILDAVVQFADTSNKGVAIGFRVATSK